MTLENVELWTRVLLVISLLVQNLEMMKISRNLDNSSPWNWKYVNLLDHAQPLWIKNFFELIYESHFKKLLLLQLILIFAMFLQGTFYLILSLLLCQFLINFRFKGSFNGGSDYMTTTTLVGLLLYNVSSNSSYNLKFGIYYIAVQSLLSYFIAGIVKLKQIEWRSGVALKFILLYSNYPIPAFAKKMAQINLLNLFFSWGIIFMECFAPLILLLKNYSLILLALLFVFHVINYFLFGLNRFVFAWLATYPSLYYLSQTRSF